MSKEDDECVTEKLCEARREAILEKIEGLKKAVYISGAAITITVTVVQLILTLLTR
ncbi:MAG: hypothetical protein K6T73_08190 [Candidatus Bathyarchaeota archaeon]|nr:hypothetical protein [Candidatus Bathyarchaeota archaeon]